MAKSYWLIFGIIGAFLFLILPTFFTFSIPLDLPNWLGEMIGNALSFLAGFLIGAGIGFFIKKRN